jgi:hypothetical protein
METALGFVVQVGILAFVIAIFVVMIINLFKH